MNIHPNTTSPHPAELDDEGLLRVARQHAAASQAAGQDRLAALLRELSERLDAAPRALTRRADPLPLFLRNPKALLRWLQATKPRTSRRTRRVD